jgi:glycosyltransferase 2 family protein
MTREPPVAASAPAVAAGRRWLRRLALLLVVVASLYFLQALVSQFDTLREVSWSLAAFVAMACSVVLMLGVIALGGLMWSLLLRDQGAPTPLGTAMEIVAIAQIAKYLPGNVGHLLGQVALAGAAAIPLGVAVSTLLISTLWLLAVGLGVGALAVLQFADVLGLPVWQGPGPLQLLGLGVLLAASPWLGIVAANRLLPALSCRLGGGRLLSVPRWSTGLALGAGFLFCFVVFGCMLVLQARWVFGIDQGDVLMFTLLFTAAWVAGYVVPGAPGGLGVREAVMLMLFTPVVGAGAAVGLGLTMRMATVAGDGFAFVLGSASRRWRRAW